MRTKGIIIAIDGPTASGKSTTAHEAAKQLSYLHLNTGSMYRAFALYAKQWGVENADDERIDKLIDRVYIDFDEHGTILLDGKVVTAEIKAPEIAKFASEISARANVRERLVAIQREIGKDGGVVLDGRDIGTVVFPDADLKIFLVASPEIRAQRRLSELEKIGKNISLAELTQQISDRDKRDSERSISPLRKAHDAVELDTTGMTIAQQVEKVVVSAREKIHESIG